MRHLSRHLSFVAGVVLLALIQGCSGGPTNRPIALGPGPGTLEATRRSLEGTWTLTSLEAVDAQGARRAVKATGSLTYDAYGNLVVHGVIEDAAAKEKLVLDFEGRIVIDTVKHQFYAADVTSDKPVDPAQIAPIAADKIRSYQLADNVLVVTYLDKAGEADGRRSMEAVSRLGAVAMGAMLCLLPRATQAQSADPLDGVVVGEIRVVGLLHLEPGVIERHLITRVGQPFRRANLPADRRALDELRLFTSTTIEPILEGQRVVMVVNVTETLRLLPAILIRVTDENGVSAGAGLRGINLLGHGTLTGVSAIFGGETSVAATVDAPTITPGTWRWRAGYRYSSRENVLYDFAERSSMAAVRVGRNVTRGLRVGGLAELLVQDTGDTPEASLSGTGRDTLPSVGAFVTFDTLDSSSNPRAGTWAEAQFERVAGDASSWTSTLDGRRFQRLSDRHGVGIFALATFQSGAVGVTLPAYLQYALGGANSVRGWSLGSRQGRNQFIGGLEYAFVAAPVRHFRVAGLNFYGGLQVVAFADVGMAWTARADFSGQAAITGYGVGVRLQVPFVDLIRLDLAWGEPGRGAVVCFGVSLKAARQRQRVR